MALENLDKPLPLQTTDLPRAATARYAADCLDADYALCHQVMTGASKNYSFASMVLPPEDARHVHALYAVMRVGDDRVDVSSEGFSSPRAAIEDWQASYRRVFEVGDSPYGVLRAYHNTCMELGIPANLLDTYFRAMVEDLTVKRFATFDDLYHYMEGSALPVGRIMTHILGTRTGSPQDAYPEADALSVAMQLTNFWRDVGEDWEIDRVYIPQEDMERFGVTEQDIADRNLNENYLALMQFEIERTETYYQQAMAGVKRLARGRWAVMSALEIYRAILYHIQRNQYNVFERRMGAARWQKALLLAKARFTSL
jgi:15-cis-phytoene synthase